MDLNLVTINPVETFDQLLDFLVGNFAVYECPTLFRTNQALKTHAIQELRDGRLRRITGLLDFADGFFACREYA